MTLEFGTVPDWFEAVGTVAAFGGIAWTLNRDRRWRRDDRSDRILGVGAEFMTAVTVFQQAVHADQQLDRNRGGWGIAKLERTEAMPATRERYQALMGRVAAAAIAVSILGVQTLTQAAQTTVEACAVGYSGNNEATESLACELQDRLRVFRTALDAIPQR